MGLSVTGLATSVTLLGAICWMIIKFYGPLYDRRSVPTNKLESLHLEPLHDCSEDDDPENTDCSKTPATTLTSTIATPVKPGGSEVGHARHCTQSVLRESELRATVLDLSEQLSVAASEIQRQRDAKDACVQSLLSLIQEHTAIRETSTVHLEARLAEKDAAIVKLEDSLAEKKVAVIKMREKLEEKVSAMARLEGILEGKDADIRRMGESLAENDARNVRLEEWIAEKMVKVAHLEEALAEKETTTVHLEQKLAEQEANLVSLKGNLAHSASHLTHLKQQLAQKDAKIDQLEIDMAGKDEEGKIAAKQAEAYYEALIAVMKRDATHKEAELEKLKSSIQTQGEDLIERISQLEYDNARLLDRFSECNNQLAASRNGGDSPDSTRELNPFLGIDPVLVPEADERRGSFSRTSKSLQYPSKPNCYKF